MPFPGGLAPACPVAGGPVRPSVMQPSGPEPRFPFLHQVLYLAMYFHNEFRCHFGLLTTLGKEGNFKILADVTNKETNENKAVFLNLECLELVCKIGFLSKCF